MHVTTGDQRAKIIVTVAVVSLVVPDRFGGLRNLANRIRRNLA